MNFAKCPKKIKKVISFKTKNISSKSSHGLQNAVLTFLQGRNWQKPIHFRSMSDNNDRNYKIFIKNSFPQKFLMDMQTAVLTTTSKIFDTKHKKVAQGPKVVNRKIFFFQKGSSASNYSYGQLECTFDIPAKKNYDKSQFFTVQSKTMIQKSNISAKIQYSPKFAVEM